MATQPLETLKEWFENGQRPTGEQFSDVFDSFLHLTDDLEIVSGGETFSFPATGGTIETEEHAASLYETLSNKATDFSTVNDTLYPTIKAVEDRYNSPSNYHFFDDFHNIQLWNATASGGAVTSESSEDGEFGVLRIVTSTSATNSYTLRRSLGVAGLHLGSFAYSFASKIRIKILSTSTQEYNVLTGLNDDNTTLGADVIAFTYDRALDGDFWVCTTRNNGSSGVNETKTVTTVPVTVGQFRLKAELNAAGTSVAFYIGVGATGAYSLVATHTTNIPTGTARQIVPMYYIKKTVGTTSRELVIDYWKEEALGIPRL